MVYIEDITAVTKTAGIVQFLTVTHMEDHHIK
jgi:hypothetical protein